MKFLAVVPVLVVAALVAVAVACTPAQQAAGVASIPADLALVQCTLATDATDSAAGMSPAAIASDLIAKCGGDAGTIATILDAHEGANAKEGIVPRNPGAVAAALRATLVDGGKLGALRRARHRHGVPV